ncbi:hypothetical protein MP228_009833 [Amoeboaphelidium protococcarum]|nr:hypothetical protein MP228_009833 [Amoeboaphelidium protococcarum]
MVVADTPLTPKRRKPVDAPNHLSSNDELSGSMELLSDDRNAFEPRTFLWNYIKYVYSNLVVTVFALTWNFWQLLLTPSAVVALVLMWVTAASLLVIDSVLQILSHLGLRRAISRISSQYGNNLSPVNWLWPSIFTENVEEMTAGFHKLGRPSEALPWLDDSINLRRKWGFDKFDGDVAQTLLLLSTIMYESEDQVYTLLQQHPQVSQTSVFFDTHCKMASFVRIFYSKELNFIVVAFKGTTPLDMSEWLLDVTVEKKDAREFLFGGVHRGFYDRMFHANIGQMRAHTAICNRISELINDNQFSSDVSLWLTGHSAGSGLATLFYTRLLRAPFDVTCDYHLRGAIVFGSPRVGDYDFSQEFANLIRGNEDYRYKPLWRVQNGSDIFCHLPFGYDGQNFGQLFKQSSSVPQLYDFHHVGKNIHVHSNGRHTVGPQPSLISLVSMSSSLSSLKYLLAGYIKSNVVYPISDFVHIQSNLLQDMNNTWQDRNGFNWLVMTQNLLLPWVFQDHFPANYLLNLKMCLKELH